MTEHEARVTRTIAAPPERVWAAWTDPTILATWYCPNPAMALVVEADVVVGGSYRIDMGGGSHVAVGTYTTVEPPRLLVFTWRWATSDAGDGEVRVELTGTADGGTHLVLVHRGLADADDASGHGEGWELSLRRLAGVLEDQVPVGGPGRG